MKKFAYFLLAVFALALACMIFGCRKERQPNIYGNWETINAVGFDWQYQIDRRGQFCKMLPEYFPETSFCYDYHERGDSTFIEAPTREVWIWEFEADDVAVVTAFVGNDPADLQKQQFVLRRTNP